MPDATAPATVPFVDLGRQTRAIRDEVFAEWGEVLDKTAFIRGFAADRFQHAFADYLGVKRVVGCNSGTDALWLAMMALGIGAGDEVIVPANTFFATPEAVAQTGATPVFVDCDELFLIDLAAAETAITPRTKAIIPVHLYGQPCDADAVTVFAKQHNLIVIEDAAQAHGARWKGARVGGHGRVSCFSFYPGKNLGAWGDAGAIATNDEELADRILTFADHGQAPKHNHGLVGWNSRLDGLQAAVLSVKLRYLDEWTAGRRRAAARYSAALADVQGVTPPAEGPDREHVWHLYVVQVDDAETVAGMLREQGVQCGFHYPVPCHRQPAFAHLPAVSCPVAERAAPRLLSLPIFGEITDAEVDRVVEVLSGVLAARA